MDSLISEKTRRTMKKENKEKFDRFFKLIIKDLSEEEDEIKIIRIEHPVEDPIQIGGGRCPICMNLITQLDNYCSRCGANLRGDV